MADHSGQSLAATLGIQSGFEIHVAGEPSEYESLVGELPEGVRVAGHLAETTDLAHLFVTRRVELAMALQIYSKKLRSATIVWVSWPTSSDSDISAEVVRDLAQPLGFIETRAVELTDQWSGLGFVFKG